MGIDSLDATGRPSIFNPLQYPPLKGQRHGSAGGLHAGQGTNPLEQSLEEEHNLRVFVFRRRQRNLTRQHLIRIESRIDSAQALELFTSKPAPANNTSAGAISQTTRRSGTRRPAHSRAGSAGSIVSR